MLSRKNHLNWRGGGEVKVIVRKKKLYLQQLKIDSNDFEGSQDYKNPRYLLYKHPPLFIKILY